MIRDIPDNSFSFFDSYWSRMKQEHPKTQTNRGSIMKAINLIITLMAALFIFNCEKQLYVETGVNWSDDAYFSADGDWYLALSEGCYSNCEGATLTVVDQLPITLGENSVKRFVLGPGSAGDITAFVYLDVNENGIYDDGYDKITGYKFNYSDVSETTSIAVSAFY